MLPYDLNKTGRAAAILLMIYCLVELLFIWDSFKFFDFYDVIEQGTLSEAEIDVLAAQVDASSGLVSVVFLITVFACYVASGMWIYRAAANAQAAMPNDNRITPGWAVGWFFVPFANLVMPYRAVRQSWNGLRGSGQLDAPMPGWALLWWFLWLGGNVASTASARAMFGAESLADFRYSTNLAIVSSVLAIGAAFLMRNLILTLTRASAEVSPYVPTRAPNRNIAGDVT